MNRPRLRPLLLLAALVADLAVVVHLTEEPSRSAAPLWGVRVLGSDGVQDLGMAMAVQDRWSAALMARSGVVGTAVGIGPDGRPVIQVFTTIPTVAGLAADLEGFDVQTVMTGPFEALQDPGAPQECAGAPCLAAAPRAGTVNPAGPFPRPVPIGVSAGQAQVTAGTVGARVTDGDALFALSNNHVFAASNDATLGDNVLQPGVADGGTDPDAAFGVLADYEPIQFCTGAFLCPENRIDAAIARTDEGSLGAATPDDGYGTPRTRPSDARLRQAVQKYGRTTGWTRGTVSGLNATIDVQYRTGKARFVDQIVITGNGFSRGGDSGSLVVTRGSGADDRQPLGLLFAGSATTTLVNPIELVLDRFDVTIDGEGGS